uniref:Uncharacterized protein n=1 Tax=Rhizophagus irregularis (strain DAOM 181602 / DAOM 197198 / MUCL 43194) TaxID=747089 RepID=U9UJ69_RHIID
MNISVMTVHLQGSDPELAKQISIFLFRTFEDIIRQRLNIDVGINEIRVNVRILC